MSGFVYAAPPTPPPVRVSAWGRMSCSWTGWDGSVWDLTDPRNSPVFLKQDGTEGMHMPSHQAWTSSSPAVHGQSYRGHSVNPREAFWPIFLYSDKGSRDWLEIDAAFWRTLQPGKYGRWSVTTPFGGTRTLDVRSGDNGGHPYTADPMMRGWVSYGVSLIADDPFWYGSPLRRTWAQSAPAPFFGKVPVSFVVATDTVAATAHGLAAGTPVRFANIAGTAGLVAGTTYFVAGTVSANGFQVAATAGGAPIDLTGVDGSGTLAYQGMPLFRISSGSALGSATMSNPGDVEAWPVWTVAGPVDAVTVGVDGHQVSFPNGVAEGSTLVIDTDPAVQSAWLDGIDVTGQLGLVDFAPIPAGEDRKLSLSMVGAGSVQAEIKPRHYKAW